MPERNGTGLATATAPATGGRADEFLALSELLTGFGRVRLAGTGQADSYLRLLEAVLPPGVLDELLSTARGGRHGGVRPVRG